MNGRIRDENSPQSQDVEKSSHDGTTTTTPTPPQRGRWSSALETFSPTWWALVMNTGVLSIIMHQLPYQFSGLGILSTIMFVFAIVLMVIITGLHLLRLFLFPKSVLEQAIANPAETCLYGCASIAALTVTGNVAVIASTAGWGYHNLSIVAYVFWWISTFCMVTTAIVVYIFLCRIAAMKAGPVPPTVFIPAVGTTTDAVIAGVIVNYSSDLSARVAVPMIIVGYILLGLGFFVALCDYAIFFQAMMQHGAYLPKPSYPSALLLVGPMGQSSSALLLLSSAAMKTFGDYDRGTFLTMSSTTPISSVSVIISLVFLGFDLFWLIFALVFIVEGAWKREIPFNLTWWSTIFPVATLNISLLTLSMLMDSPAFRGLTTALLLILLIDYFVCWAGTIWGIWKGTILDGRQQLEELHKGKKNS